MSSENPGVPPCDAQRLQIFLQNSARLLELSQFTLQGTGMGADLCAYFVEYLGTEVFDAWMAQWAGLPADPDAEAVAGLVEGVYGALNHNLLIAWYTGSWAPLPQPWLDVHFPGRKAGDGAVISARTYQEALVWPLVGAHPPAAKQQGWDAWSRPPALPTLR